MTPECLAEFERPWDHDPEALEIVLLARLGLLMQQLYKAKGELEISLGAYSQNGTQ